MIYSPQNCPLFFPVSSLTLTTSPILKGSFSTPPLMLSLIIWWARDLDFCPSTKSTSWLMFGRDVLNLLLKNKSEGEYPSCLAVALRVARADLKSCLLAKHFLAAIWQLQHVSQPTHYFHGYMVKMVFRGSYIRTTSPWIPRENEAPRRTWQTWGSQKTQIVSSISQLLLCTS